MPTAKDEKGFVALCLNKKESEIRQLGETKIEEGLHKLLGGNQAIKVKVDAIRQLADDKYVAYVWTKNRRVLLAQQNVKTILLLLFLNQGDK